MGADGHWYLMRRTRFDTVFPDVDPTTCGIWPVTILGVEALGSYADTDGRDDMERAPTGLVDERRHLTYWLEKVRRDGTNGVLSVARTKWTPAQVWRESEIVAQLAAVEANPDLPKQERIAEVQKWFIANAEDHEVWT